MLEWLFGDDFNSSVDKMAKENKLVERLFPKSNPKKGTQGKKTSLQPKDRQLVQQEKGKKVSSKRKEGFHGILFSSPTGVPASTEL